MEAAEFDENKSENIEKSDNIYDLSEEKIKKVKSKKISIGSSTLHFLPMKLKDTNKCQRKEVDNLFEKYIEKQTENNYENYDTTLFIGRILNGKRINIEENINLKIKYVSLNKENDTKNDEYKISNNIYIKN